jgi:hypothetical protein
MNRSKCMRYRTTIESCKRAGSKEFKARVETH